MTDKDEYQTGETIKIGGFSDSDNVTISIVSLFQLDAVRLVNAEKGSFAYDYQTLPGDYGKALIRAESGGVEREKQVFISKGGTESLTTEFITPANNERFYRGGNLTLKVRVSKDGAPINDANVSCNLMFPGPFRPVTPINLIRVGDFFTDTYQITESDVRSGGIYYQDYQIGRGDPTQTWVIKCVAKTSGWQGGASRSVRVVNSQILMDFLSPSEIVVENGAHLDVMLRVYYQDGSPAVNALVVLEDSDGRLAKLDKLSDSGIYGFKNYDTTSDNDYLAVTAIASDDMGNAGKKSIVLRIVRNNIGQMMYKLWWTVPMVMTIILLTLYLEKQVELSYADSVSRPKKLKNSIAELEQERGLISASKASVEENYYKRKVDEKAFRHMMEDYERKFIELGIKIKQLKRELRDLE